MKLSEALLSGALKFEIEKGDNKSKRFMPFSSKSQDYELSVGCPIFVGAHEQPEPSEVVREIPTGVLPKQTGIYFLCEVIDCLSVSAAHKWNETQVGEMVARIEANLQKAEKNERGQVSA